MNLSEKYPGAADLAPGVMVATEFSSTGGAEVEISHEPAHNGAILSHRKVRYDHPQLKKAVQSSVNRAYLILREHGTPMFAGLYFVPETGIDALDAAIEPLRLEADNLNEMAASIGSARRTSIEIYPLPLNRSNPRIALRAGRTIHEFLTRLRATYDAGEEGKNGFAWEMRMCKNLSQALIGSQRDIVQAALRSANDQRPVMIAHYGGIRGVNEVMRGNAKLPELDYGPIDKAIALFAPAADAI